MQIERTAAREHRLRVRAADFEHRIATADIHRRREHARNAAPSFACNGAVFAASCAVAEREPFVRAEPQHV